MIVKLKEHSYKDNLDEIHTFDGYYKNVIFKNNNLIIPYFNLGVSEHPINKSSELEFLNYCYMVFLDIKFLSVYVCMKRLTVIDTIQKSKVLNFGGTYLDFDKSIYNDLEISCERAFLQTLEESELSKSMWKMTVNSETPDIDNLWNFKYLPTKIKSILNL